ncbi:DUF494 domain-containing protein [Ectothiorhodospiraceae bacterium BW-2]|nr:DUF494 domain-containing protein [Ectothiorhodospiraceae bacterium BW-2]
MKQDMFDIILYLFENYIYEDEVLDSEELDEELLRAGFQPHHIDKAFDWIDSLSVAEQLEGHALPFTRPPSSTSIRHYTPDEMRWLDLECRGFLLYLEQMGVLEHTSRERVIDRVMALEREPIELEQLKWVVLMVLFNQPGSEAAAAWIEEVVIDEIALHIH